MAKSSKESPKKAPRPDSPALASVARMKAWSGLLGFAVTGLGCLLHGVGLFDTGVRSLAGGVAGYLAGWTLAIAIWRCVARAEARSAVERAQARRAGARAALGRRESGEEAP